MEHNCTLAQQNKELIHYFPSASRCLAIFQESNTNSEDMSYAPSHSYYPPAFIAEHNIIWYGISLWSAVLAVSPP